MWISDFAPCMRLQNSCPENSLKIYPIPFSFWFQFANTTANKLPIIMIDRAHSLTMKSLVIYKYHTLFIRHHISHDYVIRYVNEAAEMFFSSHSGYNQIPVAILS